MIIILKKTKIFFKKLLTSHNVYAIINNVVWFTYNKHQNAGVVKLADTSDLGSDAERCAGSSPVTRINKNVKDEHLFVLFVILKYIL